MHPITALMLTQSMEQERRLEIERRRRRLIEAEPMRPNDRRKLSGLFRIPRLATGSVA